MKRFLVCIAVFAALLLGCSDDNSSGTENNTNADDNLLVLDTISSCIIEENALEQLEALDSVVILNDRGRFRIAIPTYINDLQEKYHLETRSSGDTLFVSMEKKEDGVGVSLFCPVVINVSLNSSLNGALEEKFIATRMGVYKVVDGSTKTCVVLDPVRELPNSSSSFAPVERSSSSVSILRENPEDDRYKVYRLLYPTPEGTLDTGFFATDECTFNKDGTFKCYERSCIEDVGGRIHIPLGSGIGLMGLSAKEKDDEAYVKYFHTSTEITRLVDINLGDSALTTFIPYADIPELDADSMRGRLAALPAKTCSVLERIVGPYQFQAEGLPEGIVLYRDGAGIVDMQTSTESYSMLFAKNELGVIKESVSDTSWLREHRDEFYSEKNYADYPYYAYSNPKYTAAINDFGCGVVSFSYEKIDAAGYCHGWEIPEQIKEYSFRLINISDKVPSEPIQWKLIYMDQYGRGGTLDITTVFTAATEE